MFRLTNIQLIQRFVRQLIWIEKHGLLVRIASQNNYMDQRLESAVRLHQNIFHSGEIKAAAHSRDSLGLYGITDERAMGPPRQFVKHMWDVRRCVLTMRSRIWAKSSMRTDHVSQEHTCHTQIYNVISRRVLGPSWICWTRSTGSWSPPCTCFIALAPSSYAVTSRRLVVWGPTGIMNSKFTPAS